MQPADETAVAKRLPFLRHETGSDAGIELQEQQPSKQDTASPPLSPADDQPPTSPTENHAPRKQHTWSSAASPLSERGERERRDLSKRALLRKVDRNILPWCCAAYLINILDRNALALSRTLNRDVEGASLSDRVNLTGNRYSLLVAIFFIFYAICEMPSNFLMKRLTPSKWFAGTMLVWSAVAMSQAAIKNYTGLLIARAALGVAEAGIFPGCVYWYTFYYKPEEQAYRLGLFTSVIGLSGAFSGLLATGISFLNGYGGLKGWQYLFLIEGALGAVLAPFMWFYMPDFPQTARFLTEDEKERIITRLDRGAPTMHDRHFDRAEILRTIRRLDFWLFSVALFLMTNSVNAAGYFLPTLVADLGYKSWRAQLMTVPPNAFGFVIVLCNAVWSDYRKERVLHTLAGLTLISTGYLLLAVTTNLAARLVGVFFIACTNAAVIPFLAFRTATITGASGTAAATGFAFAIAQLSGISSPFLFPSHEGPRYVKGDWTLFGMQVLAGVIVCILWYRLGASALMKPVDEEEDRRRRRRNQTA